MATPSPQTWTLRLKSHKTTVILHVDPLHTFDTIKTYLYDALQETGLKNPAGESIPLPSSAAEIQFGCPVNINDASEGFKLGEWEVAYIASDEEEFEGKGKASKANAGGSSNGGAKADTAKINQCPKGAGLRDGAVLAFRWAGDGSWDGEDEFDLSKSSRKGGHMWGVKLASFEDAYGVENETDVGGRPEFEG
ncbi:hypothetical protein G6011_04347 [Alternaria panax]|uniref:Uncharacterized protein n=1 Tax=Alternaria panax TaxID=48097 RepID=A0AAD4IGU3_9PLEO|nr:hypothetical protein G6011_04347 [Alternaria panax]